MTRLLATASVVIVTACSPIDIPPPSGTSVALRSPFQTTAPAATRIGFVRLDDTRQRSLSHRERTAWQRTFWRLPGSVHDLNPILLPAGPLDAEALKAAAAAQKFDQLLVVRIDAAGFGQSALFDIQSGDLLFAVSTPHRLGRSNQALIDLTAQAARAYSVRN